MKIEDWFRLESEIVHMVVVLGNNNMKEDMHSLDDIRKDIRRNYESYSLAKGNEEIEPYRELTKDIDPTRGIK